MFEIIDHIQDGDLIITPNHIKIEILKELSKQKKLIDCKFIDLNTFKKSIFEIPSEESLYHVMREFKINYGAAKEYLNNIHINHESIKKYYDFLKQKKLLNKNTLPPHKRIILNGYDDIEPILKIELEKENVIYIKEKEETYHHKVFGFNTQIEEITYAFNDIAQKLKKINIEDIYLVIPNEEYIQELGRISKLYNIPIEIKNKESIYSSLTTQTFLKNLKIENNIQKALEKTPKNETCNQIINVLNKYVWITEVDETYIQIIENELKDKKLKSPKRENVLKIISTDEIYDKNKYYYILGLNQNIIPKIHKDDEIIPDKDKANLHLFTSRDKNKIETKKIIHLLTNYPNIYASYKLEDNYQTYFPSSVIEDLNLEVEKNPKPKYNHSDNYNRFYLAKLLDNYTNYGEKDENLEDLYTTYKTLNYKTYNNEYTSITPEQVHKHLKGKYQISYSNMNNFFLCPFKFYIENILKLGSYEETFPIIIGNLFHETLQKIDEKDFDIDTLFTHPTLTPKDRYYLNKLKDILKQDIEVIKMQDSTSEFKTKIKEEKITVPQKSKLDINFTGIVDKISKLDNQIIITDYKTGSVNTGLENIDDGLNLQLPSYIYLIKNGLEEENRIVGFYFQKLIHSKKLDEEENIVNNLKLDGYTIDDEKIIEKIDSNYENSQTIKGMRKSSKGFYQYTKLIKDEEIDKIENITKNNIQKVIKAIEEGDFKINPKRIKDEIISCKYCPHREVCFRKEEDITNLKVKKLKEIVGEENA